ncbi:hypothetical protein OCAR_4965 [Afipia carboxidovorans OM5]|nr:hypothetical protein OCAR_4965 [Afipia carboxidovorans OM5]
MFGGHCFPQRHTFWRRAEFQAPVADTGDNAGTDKHRLSPAMSPASLRRGHVQPCNQIFDDKQSE